MNSKRKWMLISLGAAALLTVVSFADGAGFRRYVKLTRETQSLRDRNRSLAQENDQLMRDIEKLRGDDKALERAAREELGFVRPGEVIFNLE
jgi:cell division protein FtsB